MANKYTFLFLMLNNDAILSYIITSVTLYTKISNKPISCEYECYNS